MTKWFEELGVEVETSDMSFSASLHLDKGGGFEWGTRNGISGVLVQKSNLLSPRFWLVIRDIFKFKKSCSRLFGRPQWHTVKGGSGSYVDKVRGELESMGCQIKTGCEVKSVSKFNEGYGILELDGSEEMYDRIIFCLHAPDALEVLGAEATHEELRILGAFPVYLQLATEADLGFAYAYINGYITFVDKREGLLNFLLSNDFFALYLDPSMTYSSGIFKAKVESWHHVLDIGSGWGTLAIRLVKKTGCKYTGITLSEEQLKYSKQKVKKRD
ncbi:hypothetical protein HU200_061323 [Digitaria exilis]|uniref:Uncharacterized protein n=1 Tax=Digitaria exilis TaxID=1010633 RepID=A0A835DY43_9POAL|nr:hypothetical protein HU200_061323 [Digitaria exilis]